MKSIYRQTIYRAIKEPAFAKEVFSRMPITVFDEDTQMLANVINSYYKTEKEPLAEDTFIAKVQERMDNRGASEEKASKLQKEIEDTYELDYTDVNEKTNDEMINKFITETLATNAITDSISKGSLGDSDNIEELVKKLKEILTIDIDMGNNGIIDFFNDIHLRERELSKLASGTYPTGFYSLDAIADGGLAKGEVGLAIASSGSGKTSLAVNLARNYVKNGQNVLYIPLEEKLDRMILRFLKLFSQQGSEKLVPDGLLDKELHKSLHQAFLDKIAEEKDDHWGRLWIKKYRPHELSPSMFQQLISDIKIRTGRPIDVVILDYPDLMKNPHVRGENSESDAGGRLYEDLRATAQEYDFVLWTLSQLNRTGYGQEIKKADAIEGSKRKLNAVELAMTINQTPEEFKEGFLRLWVDKLRNNSGVSFDRMLYFKVVVETMTIRDETSEEREEHFEVLEKADQLSSSSWKNDSEYSTKDATEKIASLNERLKGNN